MRLSSTLPAAAALVVLACTPSDSRTNAAGDGNASRVDSAAANAAMVAQADQARIAGSADAKIWILVASDFQCPYCKEFHGQLERTIRQEFVDLGIARLAFINYPLNIHPNAFPAAEAAMCSGVQGKFYPFHDKLFESQEVWAAAADPLPHFEGIATALGLDLPVWRSCVSSHAMQPMIQADYDRGRIAGVNSTPTILVGSEVIRGNAPIEVIREVIRRAQASTP